ncbi:hypothetical protein IJV79_00755 [bacterium]|nr:hypothetical protein [bacterium]
MKVMQLGANNVTAMNATSMKQNSVKTASKPELCDKKSIGAIPSSKLQGAFGLVPSFGRVQLDTVNLKKHVFMNVFKPLTASFVELERDVSMDLAKVKNTLAAWGYKANYLYDIAYNFENGCRPQEKFYMIETGDGKATNFMELRFPNPVAKEKVLEVRFLQSSPEIADKARASKIKGSGELALYEATKLAKENKIPKVVLTSVRDSFYEKVGFKKTEQLTENSSEFELTESMYDDFMKRIESKYNLKSIRS